MIETEEKIGLIVVKRNGKKVDFDGTKIALAIKKGFDNVNEQDEETGKFLYDEKDIKKVYSDVIISIIIDIKIIWSRKFENNMFLLWRITKKTVSSIMSIAINNIPTSIPSISSSSFTFRI